MIVSQCEYDNNVYVGISESGNNITRGLFYNTTDYCTHCVDNGGITYTSEKRDETNEDVFDYGDWGGVQFQNITQETKHWLQINQLLLRYWVLQKMNVEMIYECIKQIFVFHSVKVEFDLRD